LLIAPRKTQFCAQKGGLNVMFNPPKNRLLADI